MRRALVLLLLCCFTLAAADSPATRLVLNQPPVKRSSWVSRHAGLLAALGGAGIDFASTEIAISRPGVHEGGLLATRDGRLNVPAYLLLNVPMCVGIAWAEHKAPHSKAAKIIGFIMLGSKGAIAAHNLGQGR